MPAPSPTRSFSELILPVESAVTEELVLRAIRSCLIQRSTPPSALTLSPDAACQLFHAVLRTASAPAISHLHRALACDTLSAWLIRSRNVEYLSPPLAAGNDVWIRLCTIVLSFFEEASAALSKALKDLLTNTLSTCSSEKARIDQVLRWLAVESLEGVEVGEGRKGGYYCLDVALRKGVSAAWIFDEYNQAGKSLQLRGERLVNDLLHNLRDRNLCPAIGKACVSLLTARRKEILRDGKDEVVWMYVWKDPIMQALRDPDYRGKVQIYILPGVFRLSPECFSKFVCDLGIVGHGHESTKSDQRTNTLANANVGAILCCLKVGKDLDLVSDPIDDSESTQLPKPHHVRLQSSFVGPLLAHVEPHVRISALNLVSHSVANTRPFGTSALQLLKDSLPALHTEPDAEVRDLVIGGIRGIIERLASTSYAAEKELKGLQKRDYEHGNRPPKDTERISFLAARIVDAKDFCSWYLGFLNTLLRPCSNYQRNSTGLRALSMLIRSGVDASLAEYAFAVAPGHGSIDASGKAVKKGQYQWPDFVKDIKIFTPELKQTLLRTLFNPYEDIRIMAAEALRYNPEWDAGEVTTALEGGIDAMNNSGRARDSDGVARVIALLFDIVQRGDLVIDGEVWGLPVPGGKGLGVVRWVLNIIEQEYLPVVETDLQRAVEERPIHGLFSALTLILQIKDVYRFIPTKAWREIHGRIFATCRAIWTLTKDVLCFDSPEGHVPDDMGDEDENVNSQTVMSYTWRAISESSALLGVILSTAPYNPDSTEMSALSFRNFQVGGQLLVEQLGDIRHRGAFSAVSPSFIALCSRCLRSEDAGLRQLPSDYMEMNLQMILRKSSAITRRSGGLPYLIVGVLASEADPLLPALNKTLRQLFDIAKQPAVNKKEGEKLDLPQVHAINCLRLIFTDSRLSSSMAPFVGSALELAVSCFGSDIWAIRNCGVMLFTALTNRLFGTRRSRNEYTFTASAFTTRNFFEKYPSTRDVLLRNLSDKVGDLESGDGVAVEMVYPALSLIARLDAAPGYDGMEAFRDLFLRCMRCRIWKVREMSARAFATLVAPRDCVDAIEELLSVNGKNQNLLHGNLCAVKSLTERRLVQASLDASEQSTDVWQRLLQILGRQFEAFIVNNTSSVTKALMLELISSHIVKIPAASDDHCQQLRSIIESYCSSSRIVEMEIAQSSTIGQSVFKEKLTHFALSKMLSSSDSSGIKDLLSTSDEELTLFSIQYLLSVSARPALNQYLLSVTDRPLYLHTLVWTLGKTHSWLLLRAYALQLLHCLSLVIPFSLSEPEFSVLLDMVSSRPTDLIYETSLALLGPLTPPSRYAEVFAHLSSASHVDEPYGTRHQAIMAVTTLLQHELTSDLLPLILMLHDYLSDDDEGLRHQAAKCTAMVLRLPYILTPPTSAGILLRAVTERFPDSSVLQQKAVSVITGDGSSKDEHQRIKNKDAVLFEREKGNQYKDLAEKVDAFVEVLSKIKVGWREDVKKWVDDTEELGRGAQGWMEEDEWGFWYRVDAARALLTH